MPVEQHVAFMICVYCKDNPKYFKESLDSIYSQCLPASIKLRVYLHVDGNISSELEDLITQYPIYKVVRSPSPIGLAQGLNKIIYLLENEEFLFRTDADDICMPNRVSEQIRFMEANPSLDFSGASIYEFFDDPNSYIMERDYPNDTSNILSSLPKGSPFAHVTVCFRKTFFEKFGVYPIEYPLNEDIGLWYRSLKLGAVGGNLQTKLVKVRMESAYSRRGVKKALYEFSVYWKICRWLGKGYQYPVFRLLFRLFPTRIVKIIYNSKIRNMLLQR